MMKFLAFLLVTMIAIFGIDLHGQGFNKVQVEKHKTLRHDLTAFYRDVIVAGEVQGNVFCLGGQVTIKGVVQGNVTVVMGGLEVNQEAVVKGKLVTVGSPFVGPSIRAEKRLDLFLKHPYYPEELNLLERLKRSFVRLFLGFSLICGFMFLLPGRVRETGLEIRVDWIPAFFAGAIVLALFLGLFLGCLMTFAVPQIPLIFIALVVVFLVFCLFGLMGVLEAIANFLSRFLPKKTSYLHSLFLAVLVFELISLLPWIGPVFQTMGLILGLGATLLTRFGTNKGWFTRRKKVWLG